MNFWSAFQYLNRNVCKREKKKFDMRSIMNADGVFITSSAFSLSAFLRI